jgi:hypothetical protein
MAPRDGDQIPTWVSEYFLLKIEGLKLLGLPTTL